MPPIRRALLSVADKRGVTELAAGLQRWGVEILSTGGTARAIEESGIDTVRIADYTGAPDVLDGRIATLHPRIHGGLLGRDTAADRGELGANGIEPIDLVVVNLHAFDRVVARQGGSPEDVVELIDVGGPAMLRSAARNFGRVAVVCSPDDYDAVPSEMEKLDGDLSFETRRRLACKAFALTAAYDGAAAAYLSGLGEGGGADQQDFPEFLTMQWHLERALRYGENPHQRAALYLDGRESAEPSVGSCQVLQGQNLSYNNVLDLDAALELVLEFPEPAAAFVRHLNPCGVALSPRGIADALRRARESDPSAAYGGTIAANRPVGPDFTAEMADMHVDCILAPEYRSQAQQDLAKRRNLRTVAYGSKSSELGAGGWSIRSVGGGVLVQVRDRQIRSAAEAETASRRQPTAEELLALEFAWKVCKHARTNAVVCARDGQTVAVGAGQMTRVDAVRVAIMKAQLPLAGSVAASDGFLPSRESVDELARAGVTAIIQPGGSLRDPEVVAAADEHGMCMLLMRMRHLRH